MTRFNAMLADATTVRFFSDPLDFGLFLAGLEGHQFLSFDAVYDMDAQGKMLKKHRDNKTPNPYIGVGLRKVARTEATVCFDYCKKVERRDGELGATEGNWSQAVLVNGKITPLSTHKDDIVTEPKPGAVPVNGEYAIADLRAVLDANETVQFTTDSPRLYLRYEIVRNGGDAPRSERAMRSESRYILEDGAEVSRETLAPYLPLFTPRKDETDMQCTSLANVVELRAGGQVWRRRTAEIELPNVIPAIP